MSTSIQHGSTPLIVTPVLKVASPPGVRTHTETVHFPRAFYTVPHVTVSLHGIDAAEEKNLRIRLEASDVTTTRFDTIIHAAGVSWIATASYNNQNENSVTVGSAVLDSVPNVRFAVR